MSNSDWYARKLGVKPQPAPEGPRLVYQPAPQQVQQQPQIPQQQPQQDGEYRPKGASHLRHEDGQHCPECDSGNYVKPPGTQAAKRCYDCGYPIVQSGSGMSGTGMDPSLTGPAQPAVQINAGQGNWNPGGFAKGSGIIGRDPATEAFGITQ